MRGISLSESCEKMQFGAISQSKLSVLIESVFFGAFFAVVFFFLEKCFSAFFSSKCVFFIYIYIMMGKIIVYTAISL